MLLFLHMHIHTMRHHGERLTSGRHHIQGQTPLHIAASIGNQRCVSAFLADGRADPNKGMGVRRASLRHRAPARIPSIAVPGWPGHQANFSWISFSCVVNDAPTHPGRHRPQSQTPLYIAARIGREHCVAALLADGRADPNLADKEVRQPSL